MQLREFAVTAKVETWTVEVSALAKVASNRPHAAPLLMESLVAGFT